MQNVKYGQVKDKGIINFQIDPELKNRFTEIIHSRGLSISEYLRNIIEKEIKKYPKRIA